MTQVDVDICRLLENGDREPLRLTPGVIAANTDWQRQTVREHLLTLAKHGLVEYADESRALYQISDRGRAYLNGEIGIDQLGADK